MTCFQWQQDEQDYLKIEENVATSSQEVIATQKIEDVRENKRSSIPLVQNQPVAEDCNQALGAQDDGENTKEADKRLPP